MARKNVSAAEVRTWARDNVDLLPATGDNGERDYPCLGETARGRLPESVVKAFRAANKSRTYSAGESVPTVTFRGAFTDASGRRNTKSVTITTAEARALIGATGSKGRLPMGKVREAWEAAQDAPVAVAS